MARLEVAIIRRDLGALFRERNALWAELHCERLDAAQLRADLAELRADLEWHKSEVARLHFAVAHREEVIRALYGSLSWRAAAPIRRLGRLIGRSGKPSGSTPNPDVSADPAPRPVPARKAGRDAEAETAPAEKRPRGTIFVAADALPLFDQSSGGLRLTNLIGIMRDAGWSLVFGSYNDLAHQPGVLASPDGRAHYEAVLRERGVSRFLYGLIEIGDFLRQAGGHLDWAFLSFPIIATEVLPMVRAECPLARVAYDMVDFHALRMEREAVLRHDPELLVKAEQQRVVEILCARAADVTFAVTEEEAAALAALAPDAVTETLPVVFETPQHEPPGPEGRKGVLFIGGFRHPPNRDAVTWFADNIWPAILQRAPGTVLTIAGAEPDESVLALGARPGIRVLGYVPDLTPLFDENRVCVAPMRYGAGMKGKVGQSLLYGLPVVTTSVGAEGMGLRDGTHYLLADTADEFALQVLRLMSDDALWSRLSAEGSARIRHTLSVDVVRARLEAALGSGFILGRRPLASRVRPQDKT